MQTYTIKELETVLKRKPKTIKKYIKDNVLSASKICGRYIVTEESVREFLEETKI